MLDTLPPEDVQRNAIRIGESVRAALYHMLDYIENHNETDEQYIDPAALVQSAGIKFVKPTGTMIAGIMSQFNILLVQVVPVEPTHTLGLILEQGYHVVPTHLIAAWKQIILEAHAAAVQEILDALAEEEAGEEVEMGEGEGDPALAAAGDSEPASESEEV